MPYSALNSNFWRLNFENPSIGSRVMWPQHYDIQTDRHTYRQTYIHTERQTELKYDIDHRKKNPLDPLLSRTKISFSLR